MSKLKIKNRYAVIPNELLNNENISLKAKGLFAFIQSKPDNWNFSKERIAKQLKEGVASIKAAFKELKEFGYLQTSPTKDSEGKFIGYDYILDDNPKGGKTVGAKTEPSGNHTSISKKENSKKEIVINTLSKDKEEQSSYGNNLINKLTEDLKAFSSLTSLDGTVGQNRQYAFNLVRCKIKPEFKARVGKEPTDEEVIASFQQIISKANDFQRSKMTSFRYVYYNFGEILNNSNKNKLTIIQ